LRNQKVSIPFIIRIKEEIILENEKFFLEVIKAILGIKNEIPLTQNL